MGLNFRHFETALENYEKTTRKLLENYEKTTRILVVFSAQKLQFYNSTIKINLLNIK